MKYTRFEELPVWKKARETNNLIFQLTLTEPFDSDYRFKAQIRASAGSIMDNIAEGFERGGNKELIQFLSIAKGSCGELRSQAYRAFDYRYFDEATLNNLLEQTTELSGELQNFIKYLQTSDFKGFKYK
ncbi:MAG TPA: four helix bundle protein [Bacteroidales bacterium]|nr:four helix bundle protein [Bacteroidales bacterium]